MVDVEFLALLLILEDLGQIMYKLEGLLCHGQRVGTQPDEHMACVLVDAVHELDLLASLLYTLLVYADLVSL